MMRPRCPGQDMRYWKPGDIFEIPCPHCGASVEFFKDEPTQPCRSCKQKIRNPKLDLGCAKWCQFAPECLGQAPQASEQAGSICQRIIEKMKAYFGQDLLRTGHALAVLRYAEQILAENPDASGLVVRAAAILHDIGIHEAERKHGSSAAKYQELEGPPIAREILDGLEVAPTIIDHVCRIVANHHSAKDIDTPEFRIIWDADRLVNMPEQLEAGDKTPIPELIDRTFKTDRGKRIAETLFLERKQQ